MRANTALPRTSKVENDIGFHEVCPENNFYSGRRPFLKLKTILKIQNANLKMQSYNAKCKMTE
jgi:hypothetical protein